MASIAAYLQRGACLTAGLLAMGGCSKEATLRSELAAFFSLGDTLYYEQKWRCHAAMFRATDGEVTQALPLMVTAAEAQKAFREQGVAGVQTENRSPHDLADEMLLASDGALGKQVLASAALVGPCLDEATSLAVKRALLGRGNLLGYSQKMGGTFLLDTADRLVIFIAGEPV